MLFRIRKIYCVVLIILVVMLSSSMRGEAMSPFLRIRVVFDNVQYSKQLNTAWGFSCIIEGMSKVILFDTGADGNILLGNMRKIGFDPQKVDAVFLSHVHGDHIGGLQAFLQQNPKVVVYLPASFPASVKESVTALGGEFREVAAPQKVFDHVYTTGELGSWIIEQSLIIQTPKGLVIVTGCAHPGVAQIVSRVKQWLKEEVYVLMGGFHLKGESPSELRRIGAELKALGVKRVAPSHCTGEEARELFRQLWGPDFIESGVGAVIEIQ